MTIIQAIILGLVQGLTEFLPVSSSGHLVLFRNILGVSVAPLMFEVMVHLGTLFAVLFVLRRDVMYMIRNPLSKPVLLLVIATIPAVLAALFLDDFIESAFSGSYLGFAFLITAGILLAAWLFARPNGRKFREMTPVDAGVMGVMQAVAIIPGISRSGSTLAGGMLAGVDRKSAVRFGFLMSIPAILGSLVFTLKDLLTEGMGGIGAVPLLAGIVVAAISGFFAIKFMLKIVGENRLWVFAVYTALLGAYVILDQFFLHIIF